MREPRREALWRVRRPLGDKRLYRSSLNGQRAEAVIFLPAVYTNSFLLGVSGDNPSHTRHAVSGSP